MYSNDSLSLLQRFCLLLQLYMNKGYNTTTIIPLCSIKKYYSSIIINRFNRIERRSRRRRLLSRAAGPSAPSRHRRDRIMDGLEDSVAQNPVTNPLRSERGKGGGQVQLPVLTTGKAVPEVVDKGVGGRPPGQTVLSPQSRSHGRCQSLRL